MESVIKKLGKTSITVEKDYHSSKKEYNKLTIVEEEGTFKTYLSRKPVPISIELTNREYWIPFSGVLESITFDYLKFKQDYASGEALEDNSIIARHILDRTIERIKIALKAISEEEIDDNAVIERTIKDRNITSNKIAKENILTEHLALKSIITSLLADNSVINSKIADNTIEIEKLSPNLREVIKSATGVPEDLTNTITNLTNTITKIMRTVYPLEPNITIDPIDPQEKGTSTEVTIIWNATIEGKPVTPDNAFINGIDVTQQTFYKEIISDTKDFYIQISAQGRTKTENKRVVYVYPIFTGFSAATEFTENLVESLTKLKLRSSLGIITDTKTNTSTDNHYWIVSPYKINNITSNGINIISAFIYTTVEYKGTIYHCYRLNAPSSTDTFTFVIS